MFKSDLPHPKKRPLFCPNRCTLFWNLCKMISDFFFFHCIKNLYSKFLGFLQTWFRKANQWYPINLATFGMAGWRGGEGSECSLGNTQNLNKVYKYFIEVLNELTLQLPTYWDFITFFLKRNFDLGFGKSFVGMAGSATAVAGCLTIGFPWGTA